MSDESVTELKSLLRRLDDTVGPLDGAMMVIAAAVEVLGAHYVEAACVAQKIAAPLPLHDRLEDR